MKRFHHLGFLSYDAKQSAKYLETYYGSAEWTYMEAEFKQDCLDVGKEFKIFVAFAELDGKPIEIIQPISGDESYLMTALKSRGPGFHHIAYMYDSEEERRKDIDKMVADGFTIVHAAERVKGHGTHYLVAPDNSSVIEVKC